MKHILILLFALLVVNTLNAENMENRRMTEVSYTHDSPLSNGTASDIYHYTYNYEAANPFALDTLSIEHMTAVNNGQGIVTTPWEFQPAWDGDFSIVEAADHYTVTTAYFFMGELYRRVMVKDNAGVLLHDSLYKKSEPNVLRYRRDYEYRPDGKVSTLHHYRNVSNGGYNGYWQFDMIYDLQGLKTEEIRSYSADSLAWNPVNQLLFLYQTGDPIPDSYNIDGYLEDAFLTNFYAVPACSHAPIVGVAINTWDSGQWLQYPGSIGFEYNYDEESNLQVSSFGLYACPSELTTMVYNPRGQMIAHKYLYSGGGSQVYKTSYRWELFGVGNDDEYLVHSPLAMISNYPNPFVDATRIALEDKNATLSSVTIYNLRGQIVQQSKDLKSSEYLWDGRDRNGMPVGSGLYFVKATSGNREISGKLIKIR